MDADLKQILAGADLVEGVYRLSALVDAESVYLEVREKEGRVYDDDTVRILPDIDPSHVHHAEWMIRKNSLERLTAYLGDPLLLDVGCGNGWMSNRLAGAARVIGLDMNRPELEQAARVFGDNPSLAFAYGDLFEEIFASETFDVITLAGSIQYFPDQKALLDRLMDYLKPGGEVHIMDSPFYTERTVSGARKRTEEHYRKLGSPEMAARYHHPLFADLMPFEPEVVYDPRTWKNRIMRKLTPRSPFPWIRLVKTSRNKD